MIIPLFKPPLGQDELDALKKTFESGWVGLGPNTYKFEEEFKEYIGCEYALGVNSATAALQLCLEYFAIEGKEVISPSLTFVSTNHAIMYNGGIPVFADIDKETLCLDPEDVIKKITDKTVGIITVHYAGHPSSMDALNMIAKEYDLFLLEDAAHSMGASYNSQKVGNLGDAACFSFQALKNLTTGEGGMITTNNKEMYDKLKKLRWMGIDKDTFTRDKEGSYSWMCHVEELGYKNHMNDIQATIGRVQLKKLDNNLNKKRYDIAQYYNNRLGKLNWIKTPPEYSNVERVFCLYVIQLEERNRLSEYLSDLGISTGVHYLPNHHHPFYIKLIESEYIKLPDVPITDTLWEKILDLPLFPDLTEKELDYNCTAIENFR